MVRGSGRRGPPVAGAGRFAVPRPLLTTEMKVETIGKQIRRHAERIAMRHRVTVLERTKGSIVIADASSITSPVPFARLERGSYGDRRRRLRVTAENGTVTILAHVRAAPAMGDDARWATGAFRDMRGRPVTAWVADATSGKIHLLVDLDTAVVTHADVDAPAALLARTIFEPALAHVLRPDGPPRVGPRVVEQLHDVLRRRASARAPRFQREIEFLESAQEGRTLPRALQRRLVALRAAMNGELEYAVERSTAVAEVERLVRLVESRACGSLRVGDGAIRGLVNPRELDDTWGHIGLLFALRPSPIPDAPDLLIWPAGRAEPDPNRIACLGPGVGVFKKLQKDNDAYGLVDCVLNFIETNRMGAVPLDPTSARTPIAELLEMMF